VSEDAPANKPLVKRAQRSARGRFQKGHKLAKGRPKGSKNRATLVREQMEEKGTLMLGRVFPHLVKKALEMAMEGDREMLKEFLSRGMPKNRTDKEGTPDRIEVVINNLVAAARPERKAIEAEVVEDVPTIEHKPTEDISVVVHTNGLERVERG